VEITNNYLVEQTFQDDRAIIKKWTNGEFPPDCEPEWVDSTYTTIWNCEGATSDLVTFFKSNLSSDWRPFNSPTGATPQVRFQRSVIGSKKIDEIILYTWGSGPPSFTIEPNDRR
jgi:hypothetical protein